MKKEYALNGLKIIFRYLGNYRKDLVILSVLGVVSAVANGVVPYIAGRLFDAILDPSKIFTGTKLEMPLWIFLILVWLLIKLIADIIDWNNKRKSETLGNISYCDYLTKGFGHLLELPLSFHKNHKMGKITEKISRSANWLSTIISDVIINLAPQFLSIIVALSISFYINATLAAILVAGMAVYIFILLKTIPPLAGIQRQMIRTHARAFGDAYDAVFNVSTIKQATTEKHEQRKMFINFRKKVIVLWNKIVFIWQNISFSQRIIITVTQFIIFIFSILSIIKGSMTIGELVMFNGYAAMLFGPFVTLGHHWQSIQNGIAAVQEAQEKILNLPKENYIPKNAIVLSAIKGGIIFDNVYFHYEKKQGKVLDGISFKVNLGEKVALVGESGVGKSTLVDLISGYYFSQKGRILIDGHNVKNVDLKFLRSKIAVVPQEVVLFNDTIKKNIAYGSFSASDEKIKDAAQMAHADEFIESFPKKYNQLVGERGIKLSVGQKQRVAIARAILRDPRILILDEPTSALDAKSEKSIEESLEELMRDRTTFIIAHRLRTVQRADKILVLKDGKIAEQGRHEELIKIPDGIYRELYELQKL